MLRALFGGDFALILILVFARSANAHLSDDNAVAKMGHPAKFIFCWRDFAEKQGCVLERRDFRCRENCPPSKRLHKWKIAGLQERQLRHQLKGGTC
jgi:hypothetical protein